MDPEIGGEAIDELPQKRDPANRDSDAISVRSKDIYEGGHAPSKEDVSSKASAIMMECFTTAKTHFINIKTSFSGLLLLCLLDLADIGTDIWVTIIFFNKDHIDLFVVSVISLFFPWIMLPCILQTFNDEDSDDDLADYGPLLMCTQPCNLAISTDVLMCRKQHILRHRRCNPYDIGVFFLVFLNFICSLSLGAVSNFIIWFGYFLCKETDAICSAYHREDYFYTAQQEKIDKENEAILTMATVIMKIFEDIPQVTCNIIFMTRDSDEITPANVISLIVSCVQICKAIFDSRKIPRIAKAISAGSRSDGFR